MRLLFDQNLSRKLVKRLADIFPDSSHVQFDGLPEADDGEIWEFAKAEGFYIVTQDADFAEKSRLYGSPSKVILLRCGNVTTDEVEALLRLGLESIQALNDSLVLDCLELS
jgi:predicted nuclease of predicted toxin-antitoxin system